jgi:hypothetical protein
VSALPAARCEAAHERRAVLLLVQLREEAGCREGERVDEKRDEVGAVELEKAGDRDALLGADRDAVERLDLGVGQRGSPDGRTRPALELAVATDDALGNAAEEVPRRKLVPDRRQRLSCAGEVVGGEEQEGEIDRGVAEPRPRLPSGLSGRLGCPG